MKHFSRRGFLTATTAAAAHFACGSPQEPPAAEQQETTEAAAPGDYPIIDIHQHLPYSGRDANALLAHQRTMGISKTVMLPAGRKYGLAADAGGNDIVFAFVKEHPGEYVTFANELPDIPETKEVLEKYLKMGAIGIGEQKFPVDCDSKHIELVASIAQEFDVPVLLHFQHEAYNFHFERFHKILEKFPKVNFIGHAQTWWGNIDKNHDQTVMYPKTPVTPGGITDKYLSDYGNMYGDLSAGSGQNSMTRDEEHARAFLDRHQDKLLYGSDCSDSDGQGEKCSGAGTLAIVRRLAPNEAAIKKMFHDNAARIMRVGA
ncbi:MAG TPA: twin-arginine translocation signal domain-containing protein [Bryobacterales bacterium]|nr:twin-arginine translocation signal domain-containing protein [Bryobacterales bacterium]